MGSVNSRSDKSVAQIVTGIKRCIRIGTVEGIDIKRVIKIMLLCKLNKTGRNIVIIRTV